MIPVASHLRLASHPRLTSHPRRRGFTLVELLTVVGLVTLLVSLLMPVASKVRAAANNTSCLSNLRQINAAWIVYVADHDGRLPHYMWNALPGETAWRGYWPGIVTKNGVTDPLLLCSAAREEAGADRAGFGDVTTAWTGKHIPLQNRSAVKLNAQRYRTSSYGYNRHLTYSDAGAGARVNSLSAMTGVSNIPTFFDCAFADARPDNGAEAVPVKPPPDLRGGTLTEASPQHWRFLLGRHGRGINVAMADGSVRWVQLDETYRLTWKAGWVPYRLALPRR